MEILTGAVLIALGVAAIGLPLFTSLSVAFLIAGVLAAAGLVHLFRAVMGHGFSTIALHAFVGLLYLVIAVVIASNPLWGVASLALVVSATLVAEGLVALVASFAIVGADGSLWLLMSAIVTIVLGFVAWSVSLAVPAMVVSVLVGVNLIASGTGRLLTAADTWRVEA